MENTYQRINRSNLILDTTNNNLIDRTHGETRELIPGNCLKIDNTNFNPNVSSTHVRFNTNITFADLLSDQETFQAHQETNTKTRIFSGVTNTFKYASDYIDVHDLDYIAIAFTGGGQFSNLTSNRYHTLIACYDENYNEINQIGFWDWYNWNTSTTPRILYTCGAYYFKIFFPSGPANIYIRRQKYDIFVKYSDSEINGMCNVLLLPNTETDVINITSTLSFRMTLPQPYSNAVLPNIGNEKDYISYIAIIDRQTKDIKHLFELEEGKTVTTYDATGNATVTLTNVTNLETLKTTSKYKQYIKDVDKIKTKLDFSNGGVLYAPYISKMQTKWHMPMSFCFTLNFQENNLNKNSINYLLSSFCIFNSYNETANNIGGISIQFNMSPNADDWLGVNFNIILENNGTVYRWHKEYFNENNSLNSILGEHKYIVIITGKYIHQTTGEYVEATDANALAEIIVYIDDSKQKITPDSYVLQTGTRKEIFPLPIAEPYIGTTKTNILNEGVNRPHYSSEMTGQACLNVQLSNYYVFNYDMSDSTKYVPYRAWEYMMNKMPSPNWYHAYKYLDLQTELGKDLGITEETKDGFYYKMPDDAIAANGGTRLLQIPNTFWRRGTGTVYSNVRELTQEEKELIGCNYCIATTAPTQPGYGTCNGLTLAHNFPTGYTNADSYRIRAYSSYPVAATNYFYIDWWVKSLYTGNDTKIIVNVGYNYMVFSEAILDDNEWHHIITPCYIYSVGNVSGEIKIGVVCMPMALNWASDSTTKTAGQYLAYGENGIIEFANLQIKSIGGIFAMDSWNPSGKIWRNGSLNSINFVQSDNIVENRGVFDVNYSPGTFANAYGFTKDENNIIIPRKVLK